MGVPPGGLPSLFVEQLQSPEFLSLSSSGQRVRWPIGSQGQAGPGSLRRAAEEEEAVIGWFGPVLRASVDRRAAGA